MADCGLTAVDLFAGCGGMSLGFQQAGFDVLAGFEFWDAAADCYAMNFNHPVYRLNLADTDAAVKIIRPMRPDVIIGGPPCQDFSSAGKRSEADRASLTESFAEIVAEVHPVCFVMENVGRARESKAYASARKRLKDAGYGLTEMVLNASLCGVPQKRKRFICFGMLGQEDGFAEADFRAHFAAKPLTLREYFGDSLGFEYYYRHPRNYNRRAVFSIDEPAPTMRGVNRPIPKGYHGHPKASGITTADISDKQDKSIVAWFDTDTGTIYWYSTADTVLMNEDSSGMFANMTALESVDVSGLDSTIVSLATDMFWDDKSLKNVDATILNDAVGLSVISGIFANCANLEKIDVSGWQLGNLYYLSSAFQNCSSLKTLDVSKWNLSNVYDLNSVFAGCSSLIGLDVSNWDTSNVGSMDSTFSGCSSLVSIDVSKWDTSHVYAASGVFRGCSRLSAIDFSGWNTNGFEGVYELLSGCTNLRTITFGDGFIAPSGTETGYLRKDMFPTPLLTVSDHDSNGKWGFGSERASTTYTPDELAEHAATAKAMTGTWYAQKIETVTVTLDPNGGGGTPIVITLPKGKATPIPDPTGTDPRLPFKGWNTKKDGSGTSIPPGGEATLTEDTTLYAQWGDNPYLTDAGGIGITSAVALAALSGVLGVLMKRRRK